MRAQEVQAEKARGDQVRGRPATVNRGTTADRILALQSEAGNAAVTQAVQRALDSTSGTEDVSAAHTAGTGGVSAGHASGGHAIQRAVWTFNGSTRTQHVMGQNSGVWFDENGQSRTTAELQIDSTSLQHGDKYDDVTRQLHSSGAVAVSKRGTIPDHKYPQRETRTRKAVVEAQQKMATALALLNAAGGAPGGALLQALRSAFPLFQTATPQQIGELLPRISEVLRRVQAGLNSQGAQIALVGEASILDPSARSANASGAAGWVDSSTKDVAARLRPGYMKSEELPSMDSGRTGPINLREEGEVAWYVIHEATHRFAGTLDYQYSSYDHELAEDAAQAGLATVLDPATAAAQDAAMLGRRAVRDPSTYTGQNETQRPKRQENWYAMGRRALMNADSYAHFVMTATGSPIPRS
ncbi:hypothetical protein [Streptomyces apricus]|uniref:Uncharacterized protein n=1 Tax=Streptomyces apricus TaxID=1828112 RepID=A0A5B0AKZ0_9ACTN|nr:hypothetical protein [Streptomyces apricus]KAA0929741.1 hypothetical protein FGF04_30540 [Streptomyces apricus]